MDESVKAAFERAAVAAGRLTARVTSTVEVMPGETYRMECCVRSETGGWEFFSGPVRQGEEWEIIAGVKPGP